VLKKCNERKKIIEATNKYNVKGDEKGVVADMDLVMDENGLCRRDNKANKYVMKDTTYKYIFHQSEK
jgi:hypothetical protein